MKKSPGTNENPDKAFKNVDNTVFYLLVNTIEEYWINPIYEPSKFTKVVYINQETYQIQTSGKA